MLISRNEALERLRDIRTVYHHDPDTARELAISVLLDIVDDEHVRFSFNMAVGFPEPLDHTMKLLAEYPIITATEIERRIKEGHG